MSNLMKLNNLIKLYDKVGKRDDFDFMIIIISKNFMDKIMKCTMSHFKKL